MPSINLTAKKNQSNHQIICPSHTLWRVKLIVTNSTWPMTNFFDTVFEFSEELRQHACVWILHVNGGGLSPSLMRYLNLWWDWRRWTSQVGVGINSEKSIKFLNLNLRFYLTKKEVKKFKIKHDRTSSVWLCLELLYIHINQIGPTTYLFLYYFYPHV